MEALSWSGRPDRLVAVPVDQELDRYRLLAYLQRIDERYREHKLYPHLDELWIRLRQLEDLQRRTDRIAEAIPRELTGLDTRSGELLRAPLDRDEVLRTIDEMITSALPELGRAWERGSVLRQQLASHIRFEPVGLLPLHTREGYLLIHHGRAARVYAYQLPVSVCAADPLAHHDLRTSFIADYDLGISFTYQQVKADLMRRHTDMPVPAMFAFISDVSLPAIETFVPLARQLVYEVVAGV